jgi:hypothetical protein
LDLVSSQGIIFAIQALAHLSRRIQEPAMAKSTSTKPATAKTTKSAKSEPEQPEARQEAEASPAEVRSPGVLSSTEIGHVAGDVWGLLVRDGAQTIAAIKKSIDAPPDFVLAAIGWLAREDKLEFSTHGRSVKVSLR